jgi:hypothetical protein
MDGVYEQPYAQYVTSEPLLLYDKAADKGHPYGGYAPTEGGGDDNFAEHLVMPVSSDVEWTHKEPTYMLHPVFSVLNEQEGGVVPEGQTHQ